MQTLNEIKDKNISNKANEEIKSDLEKENSKLKEQIIFERFIFGLIMLVFFDIIIFKSFSAWAPNICIFILELIIFIIIGRKIGVKDIYNIVKLICNINNGSRQL